MATKRIADEPAYVLHRYVWSETSLILEVFTRHHGRVALVAKGAKRPTSSFRPVLLPLQPLSLAFGGDGDIRTLKSAEWVGGHVMPTGEALLSGYYLNELLMRLTARDDPHPALFEIYAAAVRLLASGDPNALQWALRGFELMLLREMGLVPALNLQTLTLKPLSPSDSYALVPEAGLQWVSDDPRHALRGEQWLALHAALASPSPLAALLRECADLLLASRPSRRRDGLPLRVFDAQLEGLTVPSEEQRKEFLRHRLARRLGAWESAGASSHVLSWLREGMRLPWMREPPAPFHQGQSLVGASTEQRAFLLPEMQRLMDKGALEPATSDRYVTRCRLVPKPGTPGKWRLVIDLRWVNKFLRKQPCRFETLKRLSRLATKGDWLWSLDLTSMDLQSACGFRADADRARPI